MITNIIVNMIEKLVFNVCKIKLIIEDSPSLMEVIKASPEEKKIYRKFKKLGFRVWKHMDIDNFCLENPDKVRDFVFENYQKTSLPYKKAYFLWCLSTKENDMYVPFMFREFEKYNDE